jgi:quercetin dioxygenase-like cupin family protein
MAPPQPIPFDDIPGSARARKFQGKDHGVSMSFFISRHAPGEGPVLHRHPYEETFICQSGTCRFTVGDETITVGPGHVVIVPPNTPHKFVNDGEERLQQVSIHPAREMQQEDLEG